MNKILIVFLLKYVVAYRKKNESLTYIDCKYVNDGFNLKINNSLEQNFEENNKRTNFVLNKYDQGTFSIITNHNKCTRLGHRLFKLNKNIIDISISVMICESILLPMDTGFGGGFIALFKDYDNVYTINADSKSPLKILNKDFIIKNKNISIPTAIKGYEFLYKKWGNTKWKDYFKYNKKIACTYDEISKENFRMLEMIEKYNISDFGFDKYIFEKDDKTYYYNKDMCDFIKEMIKNNDANYFYKETSVLLLNDMYEKNIDKDYIDLDDFLNYEVVLQKPLVTYYNNITIVTNDYPTIGVSLLKSVKNILKNKQNFLDINNEIYDDIFFDRYDEYIKTQNLKNDFSNTNFNKKYYEIFDYYKTSNVKINNLKLNDKKGDNDEKDDFKNINNLKKDIIKNLYEREKLKNKIFEKFNEFYNKKDLHSTTNIIIRYGIRSIVITSSLNDHFGSKILTNKGFFINNNLENIPSYYDKINENFLIPSDTSSLIFIKNNNPFLSIGATGGYKTPSNVLNVLNNIFNKKYSLYNSLNFPKFTLKNNIELTSCLYNFLCCEYNKEVNLMLKVYLNYIKNKNYKDYIALLEGNYFEPKIIDDDLYSSTNAILFEDVNNDNNRDGFGLTNNLKTIERFYNNRHYKLIFKKIPNK